MFLTDRFCFFVCFVTFARAAPLFCHCISQHIVTMFAYAALLNCADVSSCSCLCLLLVVLLVLRVLIILPVCVFGILMKSTVSLLEIKCASYSQKENPFPVIIATLCSVY